MKSRGIGKKVAVMQPYLFPYIGYWQLINVADTFVILDDVNFIMRGWINRNNILIDGQKHLFSVSLNKASQNKLIKDIKLSWIEKDKNKFLKTVSIAYKNAPYYQDIYALLLSIISYDTDDLVDFIHNSFNSILNYLGLQKDIVKSSQLNKDNSLKAEDRIVEICKVLSCDTYVNPIEGVSLYNPENFTKNGIELRFINTISDAVKYRQFNKDFVPRLSIVDVVMFVGIEEVHNMLNQFILVTKEEAIKAIKEREYV